MAFIIGVENNFEGRSMAWALEHPGCYAYGPNEEAALSAMPDALLNYQDWIASRNAGQSWLETGDFAFYLADSWTVYTINQDFDLAEDGYEVGAWFRHDWKPLTERDVQRVLMLLAWSRADLLDAVAGLGAQELKADHPGERWNIGGILKHVGGAEWWYLDRLGLAFPREQVPEEPFERLEMVREALVKALPGLTGLNQVVGISGEFWSPRKLLRRAIWHERDHTYHIHKLK